VSAYLLYMCKGVDDRRELEEYWAGIGATLEGSGAENLAAYTRFEILEGNEGVDGVVLTEFPSFAAAKQWYDSPAYTKLREHRFRGARYFGVLIDGGWLPPDERMPQTRYNTMRNGTPEPTGPVADLVASPAVVRPSLAGVS
jgi:uncharacterized protein (DUF1330 family)